MRFQCKSRKLISWRVGSSCKSCRLISWALWDEIFAQSSPVMSGRKMAHMCQTNCLLLHGFLWVVILWLSRSCSLAPILCRISLNLLLYYFKLPEFQFFNFRFVFVKVRSRRVSSDCSGVTWSSIWASEIRFRSTSSQLIGCLSYETSCPKTRISWKYRRTPRTYEVGRRFCWSTLLRVPSWSGMVPNPLVILNRERKSWQLKYRAGNLSWWFVRIELI